MVNTTKLFTNLLYKGRYIHRHIQEVLSMDVSKLLVVGGASFQQSSAQNGLKVNYYSETFPIYEKYVAVKMLSGFLYCFIQNNLISQTS